MKFTYAFGLAALALGASFSMAGVSAQQKTVWDGVYTEAQAKRGEAAYNLDCASCHQPDLAGDGFAPALGGTDFATSWSGSTVGDFYERIRISMPPGAPEAVPSDAKVDIVAYILKYNKFPAGKTELKDPAEMKTIKIDANKPGR